MPSFPILDTHVHLYDPSWLRYGWMAGKPVLNRPHGVAELDAARGPVEIEAFVFVEVHADAGLHLAEAAWVQAIADGEPRLLGMVAAAPVEKGAGVDADLERLLRNRHLRGVRRLIEIEHDAGICLEPDFIEGVRRVGKAGLTFDICIKHWQMPFAVELARRCPEVAFVLDHLGKPGVRHGFREPWAGQLRELAGQPNVTCKLSGLVTEADHESWSRDQLRFYIRHALDCFGPARLMFGSDWSVSSLTHTYPDWVAILEENLADLSAGELRLVFRDNGRRVYRL